jgi:hypothetical protein
MLRCYLAARTKKLLAQSIMRSARSLGSILELSTTICVFRRCSSNAPLRLARPNHFQTKPQQFPHLVLTDSADQFRRARKATNAEAIAATIAPAAMMREANAIEVAFLAWDAAANAALWH